MKRTVRYLRNKIKTMPARLQKSWQKGKNHHAILFFKEIIRHPKTMGACFPSSTRLANAMAAQVPLDRKGIVIELGGGTGVITSALLAHGVAAGNLYVIERSRKLCQFLRKRYPNVNIIEGDAASFTKLVPNNKTITAIVSGLPLRTLPKIKVRAIAQEVSRALQSESLIIQFTYDLRLRLALKIPLTRVHSKIIWRNLPPARVDVSCACMAKNRFN